MKGAQAILFKTFSVLFSHGFIFSRFWCRRLIDLVDYLTDCLVDFLVAQNLLCEIDEQDVHTFDLKGMLLHPVAFSDPAFQQIAFYGSFKELLGNGYYNTVGIRSGVLEVNEAHSGHTALYPGKKLGYCRLAAQSFFFRKSITELFFHVYFFER